MADRRMKGWTQAEKDRFARYERMDELEDEIEELRYWMRRMEAGQVAGNPMRYMKASKRIVELKDELGMLQALDY